MCIILFCADKIYKQKKTNETWFVLLNFIWIWETNDNLPTRRVMDATSIITQVSRDDEQLNVYPSDKGGKKEDMQNKKPTVHTYICIYILRKTQYESSGNPKRRHNKDAIKKLLKGHEVWTAH